MKFTQNENRTGAETHHRKAMMAQLLRYAPLSGHCQSCITCQKTKNLYQTPLKMSQRRHNLAIVFKLRASEMFLRPRKEVKITGSWFMQPKRCFGGAALQLATCHVFFFSLIASRNLPIWPGVVRARDRSFLFQVFHHNYSLMPQETNAITFPAAKMF